MSTYGPPAITKLCRFSGCVTLLGVMRIGLSGPAPPSPYHSALLIIALFLLAVALGNIVKEIAFALCAQLSNWAGFNFRRTGRTLGGTPFRDLRRSDGTWRHLERRERNCCRMDNSRRRKLCRFWPLCFADVNAQPQGFRAFTIPS